MWELFDSLTPYTFHTSDAPPFRLLSLFFVGATYFGGYLLLRGCISSLKGTLALPRVQLSLFSVCPQPFRGLGSCVACVISINFMSLYHIVFCGRSL